VLSSAGFQAGTVCVFRLFGHLDPLWIPSFGGFPLLCTFPSHFFYFVSYLLPFIRVDRDPPLSLPTFPVGFSVFAPSHTAFCPFSPVRRCYSLQCFFQGAPPGPPDGPERSRPWAGENSLGYFYQFSRVLC